MPSDSPSTQNGYLVSVFRWRVILVPKTLCMAHFFVWVTPLETVLEVGLRRTKKLWRNHNQRTDVCLFQFSHKSCRLYRCGFNIYLLFLQLLEHVAEGGRQKFSFLVA